MDEGVTSPADVASLQTLEEAAAQLVFPRLGSWMSPEQTAEQAALEAEALLAQYPVGGFLLFNGHAATTPAVIRRLQEVSEVPLLIASDLERGAGQQLTGATVFPHAMACASAARERPGAVATLARTTAREALTMGVHLLLAPVADVQREPNNPIIATRAFATDPALASSYVTTYVCGARTEGALTVAKHFPGHGATTVDSHEVLPVLNDNLDRWRELDLPPFQAALEAGTDGVMVGHVAHPALDDSGAPATISNDIVRILRDELSYDGLIISDSLRMGALTSHIKDPGEQAAACVAAGIDIILDPEDACSAVEGILRATREGHLSEDRIRESAERVLLAKRQLAQRFGTSIFSTPEMIYGKRRVGSQEHRRRAAEIADAALKVECSDPLPTKHDRLAVFAVGRTEALANRGDELKADLSRIASAVEYHVVTSDRTLLPDHYLRAAANSDLNIVLAVVQPGAWKRYGLTPAQHTLAQELSALDVPLVLGVMGMDTVLSDIPCALRICTYSDVPASQQALLDRLRTHLQNVKTPTV